MYLDLNTNILVNKEQNTMEKKKKLFCMVFQYLPVLLVKGGKEEEKKISKVEGKI